MKKAIQSFVPITILLFLLMGCSSPMNNYHEAVKKVEIEASLFEINSSLTLIYTTLESFYSTVDMFSTEEPLKERFKDAEILLMAYTTLVEDTMKEVDAIETTHKDVKATNDALIRGIHNYQSIGESLNRVIVLTERILSIMADVNGANAELGALDQPSEAYTTSFNAFLLAHSEILNDANFDFNAILVSENMNEAALTEMKANVETLLLGLGEINVVSDVDEAYNGLLIRIYGSMTEMIDVFIQNIASAKEIAAIEKPGDAYWREKVEEAEAFVQEWKDALKKK